MGKGTSRWKKLTVERLHRMVMRDGHGLSAFMYEVILVLGGGSFTAAWPAEEIFNIATRTCPVLF